MIFIVLLAINFLLILFIKSDRKWLVSILLFILLLLGFTGFRMVSDSALRKQERKYWQSTGTHSYGDHGEWTALEKMRREGRQTNALFFDLLVLQAFVTFILQMAGRKKTDLKVYERTVWIFGILFITFLCVRIMMAIVPTGFVT